MIYKKPTNTTTPFSLRRAVGPCSIVCKLLRNEDSFSPPPAWLLHDVEELLVAVMSGYDLGVTVLRGPCGIQLGIETDDR